MTFTRSAASIVEGPMTPLARRTLLVALALLAGCHPPREPPERPDTPPIPPGSSPTSAATTGPPGSAAGVDGGLDGGRFVLPLYLAPSMVSAGDASKDQLLEYRNGYAQELVPRRCDRTQTLTITCVLVDVPAGAVLRVDVGRNVTALGNFPCRPIGFAHAETAGRRVKLRLSTFRPRSGEPCRASTFLGGSTRVGPFGAGTIELVGENAEIRGVSLAEGGALD